MLRLIGFIASGLEEIVALLVSEEITDMPNGVPEIVVGPGGGPSDQGFELGEGHFYGVEIGTVGRQEEKPCANRTHGICGRGAFVGGQVVENDHVAGLQGRDELGLDIELE